MIDLTAPRPWNPPHEDYYATPNLIGSSALSRFRGSPEEFEAVHILGTMTIEPTDAMLLGSIVDMRLTSPELLLEIYAVTDATYRGKGPWLADEARNPGKILVKRDLWEKSRAMAKSIRSHPEAAGILLGEGVVTQLSHRWRETDRIECRMRYDSAWLSECGSRVFGADLKCWRDISDEAIQRQCWNWATDCQLALYERGFVDLFGRRPDGVFLVVCHNKPPYEVRVQRMSDRFLEWGRRQVEDDLALLDSCLESGDFTLRSILDRSITTIEPPRWAAYGKRGIR